MDVEFLNAAATQKALVRLIRKHNKIDVAVAWGKMTPTAEVLLANAAKFRTVAIGTDYCSTDPKLIDALIGVKNAFVAKPASGCFHPKIYYFQTGKAVEAIVGSANFTGGGLGGNHEACIHLKGDVDEPAFAALRIELKRYKPLLHKITQPFADDYRTRAIRAARQPKPPSPVFPDDRKEWKQANARLVKMEWATFAAKARADRYHAFDKRMALMLHIQGLFANTTSMKALTVEQWKGIAGTIGKNQGAAAGSDDLEWGWFGSMGGAGTFAQLVGKKATKLGAALDAVPKAGPITQEDFASFCRAFLAAFDGNKRKGRVATATRLLAMKRPDVFVCVDSGNAIGLAKALSYARTTLSLDNYWDRVIEPIRLSPWYNMRREDTGDDGELWDYRAAMLDAVYYAPPKADAA